MEIKLSRERVFILTKYYKEMAKELENIYPEERFLCKAYEELDAAFNEVFKSEAKYQADF